MTVYQVSVLMKESILCSHLRCAGNPTVRDADREGDNDERERERRKSELKGSILSSFKDEQGRGKRLFIRVIVHLFN